jgi:hypothetical protein
VASGSGGDDDAQSKPGVEGGAAEPEYPAGSWCAAQDAGLFLCDDFDEGPLGARWLGTTFPFPGVAGFSTVASSAPRSFALTFPAFTTTPCSTCTSEVMTTTTAPSNEVTFAFDLAAAGTVLAIGTVRTLIVIPLLVVVFRLKMSVEERFMLEHFGAAYGAYRERVKGLIPFVW